ncbi:MAG: ATP-dependent DNA helicase RecG [Caldimonas sp.]
MASPVRRKAKASAAKTATAPAAPDQALARLGLVRDIDLALHLPLRYEDETRIVPIGSLHDGETGQVEGVVGDSRIQFRPRRQLVVKIADDSGDLVMRFLHFYPSQQKTLAVGKRVRVRGEARGGFFGLEMIHPAVKVVTPETPLPTALTPVYPSTVQLSQAVLRKAVGAGRARADLDEDLPARIVPGGLPTLRAALDRLHEPAPGLEAAALEDRSHPAWQRLKFDELLAQQLSQLLAQRERQRQRAPSLAAQGGDLHGRFLAALPFRLTGAQQRVAAEIDADVTRAVPMHRLLQGDVGSGKTVVAALAAARAIDAGWQCALMAPTEILAEQHLKKLVGWLAPLGVTVAWLTGSRKGRKRDEMLAQVASGEAGLVVGTHAVIEEQVRFKRLGLAIIDEQHRFGVTQRLALREKLHQGIPPSPARGRAGDGAGPSCPGGDEDRAKAEPHLLMMSATPIPRTLAMTLFADLDVSTIDELPPGRTPVVTKLFADTRRNEVVARIRDEAGRGRQTYWVCPLVDESAALDLKNATATHAELCKALPGRMIGLLHGRMPAAEKAAAMSLFAGGQIAVLVATTVIEVGVDVANASLMVVEHAERFGLSQLHQLRGRVGRGTTASVCVLLFSAPLSDTAKARLKAMLETDDGFEISRRDLAIRGPGEFLGARQSGAALLRFADPVTDEALVVQARSAAERLLSEDPAAAQRHIDRWLGGRAHYLNA